MKHHTAQARRLRKAPTEAERRLWPHLRAGQLGIAFRRQHPVAGFVLDFYAPALKLAVELDGSQHAGALCDAVRTQILAARGVSVLRFWNNEVLENMDGVIHAIRTVLALLASQTPTLSLPLPGGEDARRAVDLQKLNFVLAETLR